MSFTATITDVFEIPSHKGCLVLMLNHVVGEPKKNDAITIDGNSGKIVSLSDREFSDRSCLTGQPVPRWGGVLVDIGTTEKDGLRGNTISSGHNPDVL